VKRLIFILGLGTLIPIGMSWAQLNPANESGVTLSQLHIIAKNLDAEKKVWVTMGGKARKIDGVDVIKFRSVLVFVEKGTPDGNNAGAALDHPGFLVQDSTEWLNKVEAAGVKVLRNDPARLNHGYVYTSEGMRIEINPDKPGALALICDHIHFNMPLETRAKAQTWYMETFGGKPPEQRGSQGPNDQKPVEVANVAFRFGLNLVAPQMLPSKGQTMDRIGVEIRNLEGFSKKLEAKGIRLNEPYSTKRHKSFASAQIIDPWGTTIELTEGLDKF